MSECDVISVDNRELEYNQRWLNLAIPPDSTTNNKLANCVRYAPATKTKNFTTALSNETTQCSAESFNTTQTIECTEYVHASDERNIQTEVSTQNQIHSFKFEFDIIFVFIHLCSHTCACVRDTFQLISSEII